MEALVSVLNELYDKGSTVTDLPIFISKELTYDQSMSFKTYLITQLTQDFKTNLSDYILASSDFKNCIISSCCDKINTFLSALDSNDQFMLLRTYEQFKKPTCRKPYMNSCITCPYIKLFTIIYKCDYIISLETDDETMRLLELMKKLNKHIHINKPINDALVCLETY